MQHILMVKRKRVDPFKPKKRIKKISNKGKKQIAKKLQTQFGGKIITLASNGKITISKDK